MLFDGIKKLKNGEILIWENINKINKKYNYDLENKIYNKNLSLNEWIDECYNIFDDSVKINLRADVPIGIFLSSGIDSAGIFILPKKTDMKT